MPRIPQPQIQKESRISNFQLATPRVRDIGVPSARSARIVDTGGGAVSKGLQDVSASLKKLSNTFAKKEELTRVANSQKLQFGVNEYFRQRKEEEAQKEGSQALGLVDTFRDDAEDLRERYASGDIDQKTANELTQHFNSQYNKHAFWLLNHSIKQSAVADSEARIRSIQDSHTNITSLPVGDRAGIEQEIVNTLKFEKARHPDLTEDQMETNSRSLREDYVTFALTKWSADNPTGAIDFWEKNQEYLKTALPKQYNIMAKKMEVVQDDSTYDVALGTLERMFGEDDAAAAKFVDEDVKGLLKLEPSQRLRMSAMLWSNNNHKLAEQERIRAKKEEDYLLRSHENFFDPETRTTNTPAALADLNQALREGTVSLSTYETRQKKLLVGGIFSNEKSQDLMSKINNRVVKTKGEILTEIAGTSAKPEPFYSELKKMDDNETRGFTSNWFNVAYAQFTSLASIKKTKDLPSGIKEKELLVSMTELPAFKKRLEEVARWAGLSAGDPEIVKLAEELLKSGWYSEKYPEWHAGDAPMRGWGTIGEKYQRLWEFPEEEVLQVLDARGIATGGSPAPARGIGVATGGSPTPTAFKKYTAEEEEAITRLHSLDIPVDPSSIQRALAIIKKEKGEE